MSHFIVVREWQFSNVTQKTLQSLLGRQYLYFRYCRLDIPDLYILLFVFCSRRSTSANELDHES